MNEIRESRRDADYLSKRITFRQESIDEDRDTIGSLARPEGKAGRASSLFDDAIQICILRYGRGDTILSMRDSIYQALQMRELKVSTLQSIAAEKPNVAQMYDKLNLYNYRDTLTLLCFVLASGGNRETIERTLKACDYGDQDLLIGKVFALLEHPPKTPAEKLVFHKMYTPLLAVMEAEPEARPALMKKFLEGWYKSMKPAAWYNTDRPDSGEGAYYGYWCFEAALIVRLLDIDDSSFRDNVYYPVDVVHV